MKSFLSVATLGRGDLEALMDNAVHFRSISEARQPNTTDLAGRTVANIFYEPSTRTRLSFELAARRLGANVLTLDPEVSSMRKGESIRDTALTVSAIGADILVVRHSREGVPEQVAEWTSKPVVNAGDGSNEHPTQALLDAVTIRDRFGRTDGLLMAIVGDVSHSRVANSLVHMMPRLGVDLMLAGPEDWLPTDSPVPCLDSIDEALGDVDILYLLRVQSERGAKAGEDYVSRFGVGPERASRLKEDAVIMHPGPINRGVEISPEVADSTRSLILNQVANGVPSRMAVLQALAVVT